MGKVVKLESKQNVAPMSTRRQAAGSSALTPELKDFIDRAIVPALVKQYLAEAEEQNKLAKPAACMAKSVGNNAAAPAGEI